jgi:DNA-binding PadR family transcriptional regulator
MLPLVIMIALILLLVSYLVTAVRRHDATSYADQDRDPFFAESARLAAAGLLYEEQERRGGRPRTSYTVTPAGEAALRSWLREPMNDPGLLRLYFAGIVGPSDVVDLARAQQRQHAQQAENLERIEDLLAGREQWAFAHANARLCREFEQMCTDFWAQQVDEPVREIVIDDGTTRT